MGGGGTQVLSIQTKRYTQAMGSKDNRPEETLGWTEMILSACQKAAWATKHKGDRGDGVKLQSLTQCAENV